MGRRAISLLFEFVARKKMFISINCFHFLIWISFIYFSGPPGEPSGIYIEGSLGSSSVQLRWLPPPDNGFPVKFYVIYTRTNYQPNWKVFRECKRLRVSRLEIHFLYSYFILYGIDIQIFLSENLNVKNSKFQIRIDTLRKIFKLSLSLY